MLMKVSWDNIWLGLLIMLLYGTELHCAGPWNFRDFCYIFLPNIGEDQKKSSHLSAGPLELSHTGNSPYSYRITFMKRLGDCLRLQLLGQKLLVSPELYI